MRPFEGAARAVISFRSQFRAAPMPIVGEVVVEAVWRVWKFTRVWMVDLGNGGVNNSFIMNGLRKVKYSYPEIEKFSLNSKGNYPLIPTGYDWDRRAEGGREFRGLLIEVRGGCRRWKGASYRRPSLQSHLARIRWGCRLIGRKLFWLC
jgi:hypothetical protein